MNKILQDISARDSRSIMDVALFRLSKKYKRAGDIITYELPDGNVKVSAGPAGMATIWDYDLILMAISYLTDAMNRYKEGKCNIPGRTFRPYIYEVLKFLHRSNGGKQKTDLIKTCIRLNTTNVCIQRIKKKKDGKYILISEGEPLISRYKIFTNNINIKNNLEYLEIEIAQWIYNEVISDKSPDVLTVHPDYFLIDTGIGRFIYRLARKAAGKTKAIWNFSTVYERSGSSGTIKKFTENLRKVIFNNNLPEYDLQEKNGASMSQLVMIRK